MNAPSSMYTIQPPFTSCKKIDYPECMYSMKNVLDVDVESSPNICVQLQVDQKTPVSILEQKPLPGMRDLEIRQEAILEQLSQLKLQVATLRANLSCPSAPDLTPLKKSVPVTRGSTQSFKAGVLQHDMVINASPQYPPYSLMALRKLWKNSIRLRVTFHAHSNITHISDDAKSFMMGHWNSTANENLPLLKISIVWKNVGPDTQLVITPMSRIAIRGEVNILRFLNRHGPSLFNNETENNPIFATEVDEILDTCHMLAWNRTVKERQALLRLLNGKLRKTQFFMGNTPTIADIAAWSVIQQNGMIQDLTINMGKWFERCSELCAEKI